MAILSDIHSSVELASEPNSLPMVTYIEGYMHAALLTQCKQVAVCLIIVIISSSGRLAVRNQHSVFHCTEDVLRKSRHK